MGKLKWKKGEFCFWEPCHIYNQSGKLCVNFCFCWNLLQKKMSVLSETFTAVQSLFQQTLAEKSALNIKVRWLLACYKCKIKAFSQQVPVLPVIPLLVLSHMWLRLTSCLNPEFCSVSKSKFIVYMSFFPLTVYSWQWSFIEYDSYCLLPL